MALAILQPSAIGALQSPIATQPPVSTSPIVLPSPPGGSPSASPVGSPVLWILAGLVLGGVIILIVQRTSPTDDR